MPLDSFDSPSSRPGLLRAFEGAGLTHPNATRRSFVGAIAPAMDTPSCELTGADPPVNPGGSVGGSCVGS